MFFSRKSEDFVVFDWDFDGHRLIGNINLALRSYRAKSQTPWFLSLSTPLSNPTPEGLPAAGEAEELNKWEETLEKLIAAGSKLVFVGRVTWNGHRELLYYVDKPERVAPELQQLIDNRATRPFAFRCEQDSNWSKVRVYMEEAPDHPGNVSS